MSKKLKKYRVSGIMTISVTCDVMATSEEEAKQRANECSAMTLCHHCASEDSNEQWVTSGELDGDPTAESAEVTP